MPKRYHTIVNLIALSIIAYVGVGIFYTVMRSKLMHIDKKTVTIVSTSQAATFQKKSLSDYRAIMECRNPFDQDVMIKRAHGLDEAILSRPSEVLRL